MIIYFCNLLCFSLCAAGSIDYSCSNHSIASAPAPSMDNSNFSLFNRKDIFLGHFLYISFYLNWGCGLSLNHPCCCFDISTNFLLINTWFCCFAQCHLWFNFLQMGISKIKQKSGFCSDLVQVLIISPWQWVFNLCFRCFIILLACSWAYCGGGTCVKTSDMGGHKCECNEGFSNLLNVSTLPCYGSCEFNKIT